MFYYIGEVEKEFKLEDFKIGFIATGKLTYKHVKGGVKLIETDFSIKEKIFNERRI